MTDLTGIFNELCERALKESDKHGGNKPSTPTPMPKAFSKFIEKNHSFTLAAKNLVSLARIAEYHAVLVADA